MTSLALALQREAPHVHAWRVPARTYPQPPPSLPHRPNVLSAAQKPKLLDQVREAIRIGITVCERKTHTFTGLSGLSSSTTSATRVKWAR